jgi:hypothetical protein
MSDTQTTSEATATPGDGLDAFDARVDALLAESRAEEAAKPPLGLLDETPEAAPVAAPAPTDADTARAERRARLAKLQSEERQQVDSRREYAERDQMARQLAEAQARAKSLEESSAGRIDPSQLDEAKFFELAHQLNISPQKLGEFLTAQFNDPARAAVDRATQALDPRISAAEKRAADAEARVNEYIAEQQRRESQAQESQLRAQFVSSISPQTAPKAAAFLGSFGQAEFLKIADAAANSLPAGAGAQDLIDEIEEGLGRLASAFGTTTPPSSKHALPHVPTAAAKAITVSNSHAQDRATVVDDDDFASLPVEERAKRLIAAM